LSVKASDGTLNDWFGENGVVNLKTPEVMQTGRCGVLAAVFSTIYKDFNHHRRGHRRRTGRLEWRIRTAGDTRAWDARPASCSGRSIPSRGRESPALNVGLGERQEPIRRQCCGATRRSMRSAAFLYAARRPNNDRVGIDRPGNNLFSSSVVAVDANHRQVSLALQLGITNLGLRHAVGRRFSSTCAGTEQRFPPSSSSTKPD